MAESRTPRVFVRQQIPRFYRLAVLLAAAWLIRLGVGGSEPPAEIRLDDAQRIFSTASELTLESVSGRTAVFDAQGKRIGSLLTTSPETDDIVGYSGPNNLLIGLDAEDRVAGIVVLSSGDTAAHVAEVERSRIWSGLIGWKPKHEPLPKVEAVSGSTLTSLAMAEAVNRKLRQEGVSLRFPEPVTLEEARSFFPNAATLKSDAVGGRIDVLNGKGSIDGILLRTSPYSDNVRGYKGPTESLVALSADGQRILDVRVRKSFDTPEYVGRVRDDDDFRQLLARSSPADWATMDFKEQGIEGVSGATQTSFAVAEGLRRRFAADVGRDHSPKRRYMAEWGLAGIIVGALLITFTPLRTNRWLKWTWNGVLVVVFALWLGDLISVALLGGWARGGIPHSAATALIGLVAVALTVPWATRRQIYCQSICPHGAAQSFLGRFKRLHVRLSARLQLALGWLPGLLIVAALVITIWRSNFDLASLEPFDAWVLKTAAPTSAIIAIVGLVASLFVPQGYCRYGCPTGELLRWVKSGGRHDAIRFKDWLAGGIVLLLGAAVLFPRLAASIGSSRKPPSLERVAPQAALQGRAFGTTWAVKIRGGHSPDVLQRLIAAELERIESTLSHWRPESATAQFNASETTFATEQPAELVALVIQALDISRQTNGAYDITVAPLVSAWGFGPDGEMTRAPTDDELQELLKRTGWQKLAVDQQDNTLRKLHPQLQIDLGSLLQGYAADCVAKLLSDQGYDECLVEMGGELVARGKWQVAIEDPLNSIRPLKQLTLNNQALATSGNYRGAGKSVERKIHHLISPGTGRPVETRVLLCSVVAPSGLLADAWATALFVTGLPEALPIAAENKLSVLLLDDQHQARTQGAAFETAQD